MDWRLAYIDGNVVKWPTKTATASFVASFWIDDAETECLVAETSRPKNPFAGRWRITWMEQWDQDFVNAEVEGYFKFRPRNIGSFQFGYVLGEIDYRLTARNGIPCLEFFWEGNDEMDLACGRGWAIIEGDDISGVIFFHQGGESAFKARQSDGP